MIGISTSSARILIISAQLLIYLNQLILQLIGTQSVETSIYELFND